VLGATGDDINVYNIAAGLINDIDGDGIINSLDIDSDNDGITDSVEAQLSQSYKAPSGTVDANGIDIVYGTGLIAVDTDGDGTADYKDSDSDNDGRLDIIERGDGAPVSITATTDTDGDGLLDIFEGSNVNDGYDVNDQNVTVDGSGNVITYQLADSDNDVDANGDRANGTTENFDYRDNTEVSAASFASQDKQLITTNRYFTSIVGLSDGGYLVSWGRVIGGSEGQPTTGSVLSQKYFANGEENGAIEEIYSRTTNSHWTSDYVSNRSAVLDDGSGAYGGYVLAYTRHASTNSSSLGFKVYDGLNLNPTEVRISIPKFSWLEEIKALDSGNFALIWREASDQKHSIQVFTQAGVAVGARVSIATAKEVDVIPLVNHDYIIVYHDYYSNIKGQKYNAAGIAQGGEFELYTDETNYQLLDLEGTALANGQYMITWQFDNKEIYAKIFDQNSNLIKDKFELVSAENTNNIAVHRIAALENGDFVLVWEEGTAKSLFWQVFAADGSEKGEKQFIDDGIYEFELTELVGGSFAVNWKASSTIYSKLIKTASDDSAMVAGSANDGDSINLIIPEISQPAVAESMQIELAAIPQGYMLAGVLAANGNPVSFTASATSQVVDISTWDLNAITITSTIGSSGDIPLTLIVTISEGTSSKVSEQDLILQITCTTTPLILDLDNDGVETLSVQQGVSFDIDADGIIDRTGWVAPDDAFLVWDRNGDGQINDASELFGEHSIKADGSKALDGFDALRDLDANQDQQIDKNDLAYTNLQLWRDSNSDGLVQAGELLSLAEAGVEVISLVTEAVSEQNNGNWTGIRGQWSDSNGQQQTIDDVWFSYTPGELSTASSADTEGLASQLLNSDEQIFRQLDTAITQQMADLAAPVQSALSTVVELSSSSSLADILVDDNLAMESLLAGVAIDESQLAAAETTHSQRGIQPLLISSGSTADSQLVTEMLAQQIVALDL